MKRILLIATGGTIASKRTENGLAPLISSEELMGYVPAAKEFCEVETLQLLNLDSTNIRPEHWIMMANAIEARYDSFDGFVICHGTDTMAFTAAGLSYLIQNSPKPIVLTGAQKPIDMENTDARINLLDSLRYACCSKAHDVSVVFGGKVIAGTRARKMRAKSYNAFDSINFPHLASIQDERIVHYITSECSGRPAFYHELNSRVFLLKLIPGLSPNLLSLIEDSYDAFIIEGYGVGGLPDDGEKSFLAEVERLVERGKIVVMATQVVHEGSDMTVYEVGHLAKEKGLMECRDMTLEAAVAKLMWILAQTSDPVRVRAMFNTTIRYDLLFT